VKLIGREKSTYSIKDDKKVRWLHIETRRERGRGSFQFVAERIGTNGGGCNLAFGNDQRGLFKITARPSFPDLHKAVCSKQIPKRRSFDGFGALS
jgi:hypothetical protein